MSDLHNDSHQETGVHVFDCKNCKGVLEYTPGNATMTCPYCGTENEIPEPELPAEYEELDFESALSNFENATSTIQVHNTTCPGCRAEITIPADQTTTSCDFCGTQVVVEGPGQKAMEPQYMVPFGISVEKSKEAYREWLSTRRFAPAGLKTKARRTEPLKGIYLPFWTYDSKTATEYTGSRGDDYTTTESYTDGDGKRQTRTVTRTRWRSVSGSVRRFFDDVLVEANRSVPVKLLRQFKTWDLSRMVAYSRQYLAGFAAESYTIDLREGLDNAKEIMKEQIRRDIRHDIGGDHQKINSMNTRHDDVTFKYVLLPVWATMFKFKEKYYPVVINGQTGEVQGERPISWIKIALLVLLIAGIGVLGYFTYRYFAG